MKKEYTNPSIKLSMFDGNITAQQQISGIDGEAAAQAAIAQNTSQRIIMRLSETNKVLNYDQ